MAHTACLVCFISTVNGNCNKKRKRKEEAYPWKAGASSGHTTNLKQSILRLSISMVPSGSICSKNNAAKFFLEHVPINISSDSILHNSNFIESICHKFWSNKN